RTRWPVGGSSGARGSSAGPRPPPEENTRVGRATGGSIGGMDEETVPTELTAVVARAGRNGAHDRGPFADVLVLPDGRRFEGVNQVVPTSDPTAHAEVVAIRHACAATGSVALEGAVVYASCEPCPMCVAAALWARVDAVYYAADRHDAARAGFD